MLNFGFDEAQRFVSETLWCPAKNRYGEVTFGIKGRLFPRKIEVVACPAKIDGGKSCDLKCLRHQKRAIDLSFLPPRLA
jgi:hypothetical protein